MSMNRSLVTLTSDDYIHEPDRYSLTNNLKFANHNPLIVDGYLVTANLNYKDSLSEIVKDFKSDSLLFFNDSNPYTEYKDKGVPQGGACSPTLATLCLDLLFEEINSDKSVKLIMYADDGLIFAKSEHSIKLIEAKLDSIVSVSKEKSSYIKFKGSFCKKLKFCGLIYDASSCILSSCTRSGKTLTFGPIEQYLTYL
jgi:hypothetical protein